MPKVEDEDTDQIVIDLTKECGVEESRSDRSTSHRLEVKKAAMPPIVVRLVRREKTVES